MSISYFCLRKHFSDGQLYSFFETIKKCVRTGEEIPNKIVRKKLRKYVWFDKQTNFFAFFEQTFMTL